MRRTKSSSLKQKRANKHLRGIKNYTLSRKQKSFDYVSTFYMLFVTNAKYRVFAILRDISFYILLALVPINLFLGFIAYVTKFSSYEFKFFSISWIERRLFYDSL